jgi:hypothetical protein
MDKQAVPVTFVNVATGAEADAEVPLDTTREAVLETLLGAGFLPLARGGDQTYRVEVQGKSAIAEKGTLRDAGVKAGDRLLVAEHQRGGALSRPRRCGTRSGRQ